MTKIRRPPSSSDAERVFLDHYDPGVYPQMAVAVDLAVFTVREGLLKVLLIRRAEHPFKRGWALPGGFVRPHESLREAAQRELAEETGVRAPSGHLEQLATYGDVGRDPRMRVVSVAYVALVPELEAPAPGGDAQMARLWPVEDVLAGTDAPALAFDHGQILVDALERVRSKLEYTNLGLSFVSEPFTIADLRRIYEAIWGVNLDAANFRRKVLGSEGLLMSIDATRNSPDGGRPPGLFVRGSATRLDPPLLRPGQPRRTGRRGA